MISKRNVFLIPLASWLSYHLAYKLVSGINELKISISRIILFERLSGRASHEGFIQRVSPTGNGLKYFFQPFSQSSSSSLYTVKLNPCAKASFPTSQVAFPYVYTSSISLRISKYKDTSQTGLGPTLSSQFNLITPLKILCSNTVPF